MAATTDEDDALVARVLGALDAAAGERREAHLGEVAADLRPDEGITARVLGALDAAHAERREHRLAMALQAPVAAATPMAPTASVRRARRVTVALLLALAAALAVVTWLALRPPEVERPFAFGGDPAPGAGLPSVLRDEAGRLREIVRRDGAAPDGERLVFRSGRLIRIEHWAGGKLDGVVIDLDARGRVVATHTWQGGVERGPWLELDEAGQVRASGVR